MKDDPLRRRFGFLEIMKFTLPNMVMMVFTSFYTIADGMFISRYAGELALGATNIYYPVMSIQYGLGIMIGTGGSAVIALKLGQGRKEEAREDFTVLTVLAFAVGLLIGLVCIPFIDGILALLGASALQAGPARTYAVGCLCFSPMMFLQMVAQAFFVTAGKPHLGLGLTVAGGLSNMVLDWLFMGPMHMGILGASIATGIGWSIPSVFALIYFTVNRKQSLFFTKMKVRWGVILKTCTNGSSEMVSNVAIAVTTFLFNIIFMRFWKEAGITTITILSYYQFVFNSLFLGFSMGIAPVISYKYGAGDREQLEKVVRCSLLFVILANIGVWLFSHLTIRWTLGIFTDRDSPVYDIAMGGFGIFSLQFLFAGFSIMSSGLFTALNDGLVSGTISFLRTFLFLVLSLLVLPEAAGEIGVWLAVPVAEFLGFLVSVFFVIRRRRRYHY